MEQMRNSLTFLLEMALRQLRQLKRACNLRNWAECRPRIAVLAADTCYQRSGWARWSWAALLVGAGVACTSALPEPTSAHVALAQQAQPGTSLEDLQRGRTLYLRRCGNCHALRDPSAYNADEWRSQVERMEKVHKVHLTSAEETDILRYLDVTSAKSAP
jgi:cytochrome c5